MIFHMVTLFIPFMKKVKTVEDFGSINDTRRHLEQRFASKKVLERWHYEEGNKSKWIIYM